MGAGDVAQRLRALATLPKDSGLICCAYMVAYNCLLTPVPCDAFMGIRNACGTETNLYTKQSYK